MAKKTEIVLIDDLDGGKADGTVKFGLDGQLYEIDLSNEHSLELYAVLAKFRDAGTRLGRVARGNTPRSQTARAAATPVNRERNEQIRAWAAEQGHEVSPRGRIPQRVVEAYEKASLA